MTSTPLISVIIPAYNRENTLSRSINSVIEQEYQNWELIISDDGSQDKTQELIKKYSSQDKRIRYVKNQKNKGPASARNLGMINSKGEYLAFLDSDDTWVSTHLSTSLQALQEEELKLSFALWWEMDSNGNPQELLKKEIIKSRFEFALNKLNPKHHDNRIIFSAPDFFALTSLKTILICNIATMVFHRSIIDKVGLMNESLWAGEDMEFMYRILYNFNFCLILEYHMIYNKGTENLYNFIDRENIIIEEVLDNKKIVNKFTFYSKHNCKMTNLRMAFIKKSTKLEDKKIYINRFNMNLSLRYYTMAVINHRKYKIRALYYLLKSIIKQYGMNKIKLGLYILFPFIAKAPSIKQQELLLY